MANLGLFVMNHTVAVMSDPRPEHLGSLITINREVAAGLLGADAQRHSSKSPAATRGFLFGSVTTLGTSAVTLTPLAGQGMCQGQQPIGPYTNSRCPRPTWGR